MDSYDPRRSRRVSVHSFQPSFNAGASSSSLPSDLILALVLTKSLLAIGLFITRDWLLAQGFSVWSLNAVTLTTGAVGLALWERVWETPRGFKTRKEDSTSPLYPLLFALEMALSLLALTKLSVLRFIVLTSFSGLWARGLPLSFLSSAGGKKALGKNNAVFITIAMVVASYFLDAVLSSGASRSGYAYLLGHLLLTGQRSDLLASQPIELRPRAHALGALAAAGVASVLAGARWVFASPATTTVVVNAAKTTTFDAFSAPEPTLSLLLPAASLLALTLVIVDPLLSRALLAHFPAIRQVSAGWPIALCSTLFVGYVGFGQGGSLAEAVIAGVGWNAITHLVSSDPRSAMVAGSGSIATSARKEPFLARLSIFYRYFRATIKTILATPDSRKIYFFLCLNLAYMFVQMAYGIWTNSLGLISDSIHMFFDCLALAMGLFASVMATWASNDKFTYGYTRVETLSGFANGLFLCLISIFIVFEAIQRLLDPPEMNTGQLLVVSSVGLAVNLVGMFATGHGHHGHSHGGGHSHASHSAPKPKAPSSPVASRTTTNDHDHHGHSHSTPVKAPSHGHSHDSPSHASHDDHGHASHGGHGDDEDEEDDDDCGDHAASGHSHNMKGVFLHVMADTLGSVGVILSTLLINRYGWTGFDPLASIFIAVLIFASVVPLVVDSGRLLILDMGEEREAEVRKALMALNRVEGLSSYSSPRFWSKDPASMVGSICIQLAPSPSSHDPSRPEASLHSQHYASIDKVTARVRRVLRSSIAGLSELTIQVEPTHGLTG